MALGKRCTTTLPNESQGLNLSLLATSTAIAASGTATVAYLDAKFHLRKDVQLLWALRQIQREYLRNGTITSIST